MGLRDGQRVPHDADQFRALAEYLDLMRRFVATQRDVTSAWLGRTRGPARPRLLRGSPVAHDPEPALAAPDARVAVTGPALAVCARGVMRAHPEPVPPNAGRRLTAGRIVVVPGAASVAAALADALAARSVDVVMLGDADLVSEEILIQRCVALAAEGPVGGVAYLAALGQPALTGGEAPTAWRQALWRNEKALFVLLRELFPRLARDAHVLAATDFGGRFGRDGSSDGRLRLAGGSVGTLKSFRAEHETLRVKAVDLDPAQGAAQQAAELLAEMELQGGRQEVGYPGGVRTVFKTSAEDVRADPERAAALRGLVVLATGGARGITAEVLRELAVPGNTLVLAGRTPLAAEPPELAPLADGAALRNHFVAAVREGRENLTPKDIGRRVGRILAQREMRANLADLAARGAAVEYIAVDVTDEAGVRDLVADVTRRLGPISGVVHGAGIIEDRLLVDKASASWSRVVETKVIGLLLLQKYLDPSALRFFTVFSSVAGRYGNSGQSDYACANELMNRACVALQQRWGGGVTVSAFCWGPWGATRFGAGMVTAATEAKFARIGVKLVSAELGRRLFREELARAPGLPVEIVCGEAAWDTREEELGVIRLEQPRPAPAAGASIAPLLDATPPASEPTGGRILSLLLDPARHAYLLDHVIDGKPVLPAAMALEILAESARLLWSGWKLVAVREHRLMKGIELASGPRPLRVFVQPPTYASSEGLDADCQLQSEIAPGKWLTHYRATVCLAQLLPDPVPAERGPHGEKSLTVAQAYGEWLFHGPRFRVIREITGLSRNGAGARVCTSRPEDWVAGAPAGSTWAFDPALLDAAAQMAWLWARAFRDESALPARFGRVVRYREALPAELFMEYTRIDADDAGLIRGDVTFLDDAGEPVLAIEELDSVASAALNRLGGTAAAPVGDAA